MSNINICAQDAYLALYPQSKKPVGVNWPDEGTSQEQALATNGNLGLLLGPKSDVMDVDLDCTEAKEMADLILPKPFAKFDRGTSDSGHYLYRATTCGPTKKFSGNGPKSTLVELRGDGSQTMIPPSIHPNGSHLRFTDINQDAPEVKYADLLKSVSFLAACSEVAQRWVSGQRHELALSFSGLCLKQEVDPQLLVNIIQRICKKTGDQEAQDRMNCVRTSVGKPHDELRGYNGLVDCIGKAAADRIAKLVRIYCGTEERSLSVVKEAKAEVINFGRFTDGANVTEAKLGETFAQWLDGKAIYIFQTGQWMIWNGGYWCGDECGLMTKLAFNFISDAKQALFDTGNHSAAGNLSSFESLNRLENLCKLAVTDRAVSLISFDTDPMLLAAPNQWIDLKSGEAFDPDPSILVSKAIATDYCAKSECPNFEAFVNDIFEGEQDLIGYVQRAIGYGLTGSTAEQCLFILIGDGANGKSTFVNVMSKLLGDYSKAAASQTLVAKGSTSVGDDLVDLVGARFIPVSETEEGEALAEAKIKQMTGGDVLKARPLYGKYIQFSIIGKIFLATNSLPQINNTDHGIWRRIQAIPFNRTFTAEEQDKDLGSKLTKELPGILNWAIKGCLDWQKQGLNLPQTVLEQVSAYKTEMDSFAQFIRDECKLDPDIKYPASKLYETYRHYCQAIGRKPQSTTAFKKALDKLTGVYQSRTSGGMQWQGIQPVMQF
jgi:putative DNA primase/helicase